MTQKRVFLIQRLLEALIPIIGYFQWRWDLSFILLFYLLDWLLVTFITTAKGIRRFRHSSEPTEKKLLYRAMLTAVFLLLAGCLVTATAIVFLQPSMSWTERIHAFLVYEDMGIQQGIVLIPLMVLNGVLVYRQQFIMPARYRTQTMQMITAPLVRQGVILLACAGALLGVVQLVAFPQEILIFVSIAAISTYRWLVLRNAQ